MNTSMFWYVCFCAARRCLILLPRGLKHRSTLVVALFYFAAFKAWIPFFSLMFPSVDLQFSCVPHQIALPCRPFLVHLGLITIHASVLNYPGQYVLTFNFVSNWGNRCLKNILFDRCKLFLRHFFRYSDKFCGLFHHGTSCTMFHV